MQTNNILSSAASGAEIEALAEASENQNKESPQQTWLQSIAFQSFPGAILCARGMLIRLYDGSYGKKLKAAALEKSVKLFKQNAFLTALAVDMLAHEIPFEQCEFFAKFSDKQKERLQIALQNKSETEFTNIIFRAMPNQLSALFQETIAKDPIPDDLFCAYLSLSDYQNEYLVEAFRVVEKFDLLNKEQQEEAIQSILAIPYPIERSLCLSEFCKTLFSVNRLKALELVFQIPDKGLLHITLKMLLKQEYLTEGREALFAYAKNIQNDRNQAIGLRKLIFIVLENDKSSENLQKLYAYLLEIENLHVRTFCLDIFSKQIEHVNPEMAKDARFARLMVLAECKNCSLNLLRKGLQDFSLSIDKAQWEEKIIQLLEKIRKKHPNIAFEGAAKLLVGKSFEDFWKTV